MIILVMIFTVFFGIISTQLRVNSDLLEIMPQDSEIVIELQKELLLLEDSDVMVAAFFLNEESDPHQIAKAFSEQMLQESTFSTFIQTDLSFLFSYGIINLSQTDILYEIYENIQNLTNNLTGNFTYDFKIFEQIDNFIDSIYSLEQVLEEGDSSDPVSSYYALSPDRRIMIMGLTFNEPASNLEYVNYIVPRVKSILKNIENNYNIRTGLTNSYIGAYESNKTVMEDFTRTTVLSIILITILFAFAFGNFTLSFIVLIGLLVSTLLTLGFITLTFQELNIVTSFVMAITLGLGIDYGIHIITRFSKHMEEEEDFISALTSTYKGVISPIFLGMITTILVFLTLLFMGLPAFNELAIVSSIGLIIFFLVMSFFVPALVYMFKNKIKFGSLSFKINNFFKTLPHKISQNSKIIFIVIAPVVLIFSVIGIFNYINFSYTPPGLISSEAESVKIGEEVLSHFGTASFDTMHYLLRVDEDLEKTKKELMDTGVVKSVSSLPDIIRENIGDFPIIKSQLEGFSQVINNPIIISILNKYNLYSDSLKLIDAAARSSDLYHFTLNTLNILPEDLRNNFLVQKDGYDYLVLEITPKFTLWEDNGIKKFFDALGEEKTERIMGLPKATYKIMEMVRNRFYIPLLLSFVFIWGTTAIVRKNVIQPSEAMLSLILSVLSTFGVSYLIGIRATFVTVLTFPLIFGIGIDGFLHLYHTFSENKMNFWNSLKSITFSLITTTLSFLSFQVSRGDLLKEFSLTMSMSLGFTWLFTTIIFIVNREILRKFWRGKKKTD
ncbi:hypothetical protein PW5551_04410 [Petrotoga sp. 9PW.55.5.1]|nr:hypothetical protein PW5551_04410 [Petrotoga sp. 9PW.55.5.1]